VGVAIGDRAFDPRLQEGARHVVSARNVPGIPLLLLAHVDEHGAVAPELRAHLGRIDLPDGLANLADDLGSRRAHWQKPLIADRHLMLYKV